jgi:hypothetical protein
MGTSSDQFDPYVYAIAVFDDGNGPALYAGGDFQRAGGGTAFNIAKWDGSSWSPVGGGMNPSGRVFALEVFDDGTGEALYAAGEFSQAGGVPVSRIAKWDGVSWSPVGTGVSGSSVTSLAVFDDGFGPKLYAGGTFSAAGSVLASNIAAWDGSEWSALGLGVNDEVRAICEFDNNSGQPLYVSGSFTGAGPWSVEGIARWGRPCVGPVILSDPESVLLPAPGGLAELAVVASGFDISYQWVRDGEPLSDSSSITGSRTDELTIFSQGPSMTGIYSCLVSDASGNTVTSDPAVIAARPSCTGDVNSDGVVDLADLNLILSVFGSVCP